MGDGSQKNDGNRETRTGHYCQKVDHLAKNCYKRQRDQVTPQPELARKQLRSQDLSPSLVGPGTTKLEESGATQSPDQLDADTTGATLSTTTHAGAPDPMTSMLYQEPQIAAQIENQPHTSRSRSARRTASASQELPLEHQRSPDDQRTPEYSIKEVSKQRLRADTGSKTTRPDRSLQPVQPLYGGAPTAQVTTPRKRPKPTPRRLMQTTYKVQVNRPDQSQKELTGGFVGRFATRSSNTTNGMDIDGPRQDVLDKLGIPGIPMTELGEECLETPSRHVAQTEVLEKLIPQPVEATDGEDVSAEGVLNPAHRRATLPMEHQNCLDDRQPPSDRIKEVLIRQATTSTRSKVARSGRSLKPAQQPDDRALAPQVTIHRRQPVPTPWGPTPQKRPSSFVKRFLTWLNSSVKRYANWLHRASKKTNADGAIQRSLGSYGAARDALTGLGEDDHLEALSRCIAHTSGGEEVVPERKLPTQTTDIGDGSERRVLGPTHAHEEDAGYLEPMSGAPVDTALEADGGVKIDAMDPTLEGASFQLPEQIQPSLEHKSGVSTISNSNAMATARRVAEQHLQDYEGGCLELDGVPGIKYVRGMAETQMLLRLKKLVKP